MPVAEIIQAFQSSGMTVKSWEDNWDILPTWFAYPVKIRKIIYIQQYYWRLKRTFSGRFKNKGCISKWWFIEEDALSRITEYHKEVDAALQELGYSHTSSWDHAWGSDSIIGALPRIPKFNALVSPKTGKTSENKFPPVLEQKPQDRSGRFSA